MNAEEKIWIYLKGQGLTDAGAAGLMGNLYAESGLRPNNLQNNYEGKLGMADAEYTAMVDRGTYTGFVRDSAGYGLCQWTYWSRKEALLAYAKATGRSIGNLEMQLDFLMKELSSGYKALLDNLKTATSVQAASDAVLLQFERPADQSAAARAHRAGYGQKYFDKYAAKTAATGGTKMNRQPVSYLQNDPRWKNKPYRVKGESSTIGSAGCGPTSAAMLIETITGKTFTPEDACAWSIKHGYKALKQGTYYSYFAPQFKAYGIECKQLLGSRILNQPNHTIHDQVKQYLQDGYYIIALMGPGTWTTGGHFIVVWDWDNKVRINDPASTKDKRLNGDPATFRREVRCYWLVDARAFNRRGGRADEAIDRLTKLCVINSPDLWKSAAASGKVKHLDTLLIKAAAKITKARPRSSTPENGIGNLVAAGVIDTPDYWLAHYNDLPNLGALLCALGGAVK